MTTEIQANATSPQKSNKPNSLPMNWVEAIFQKMEDRYPAQWAANYGPFPRARVMETWAEDLADLTREQLHQGLRLSRDQVFPPNLAEFRALCRVVDYEATFQEAQTNARNQVSGQPQQWSSKALYWAASEFGWADLRSMSYLCAAGRWKLMLDSKLQKREGLYPEPPVYREALPDAGGVTVPPEQVSEMVRQAREMLAAPKAPWVDPRKAKA